MTNEQFLSLCKPGVTLADFKPRKLTPEESKDLDKRLEECRHRQKECLARKEAPFRNYRITI